MRADGADADRILGRKDADALGAERNGLVREEEVSQTLVGLFDLVQHLERLLGLLQRDVAAGSAVGDHAVVDAVAGQELQDVHDGFAVIP